MITKNNDLKKHIFKKYEKVRGDLTHNVLVNKYFSILINLSKFYIGS